MGEKGLCGGACRSLDSREAKEEAKVWKVGHQQLFFKKDELKLGSRRSSLGVKKCPHSRERVK